MEVCDSLKLSKRGRGLFTSVPVTKQTIMLHQDDLRPSVCRFNLYALEQFDTCQRFHV